jgi:hypothetical protein
MKNKARLSDMTAFSFGNQHIQMKIDQPDTFKKATVLGDCLCFTCKNETAKSALIPTLNTLLLRKQWQALTTGGIILYRLLVPV